MADFNLNQLGNIEEKLALYEKEKCLLEKLIDARKNEIVQLETL